MVKINKRNRDILKEYKSSDGIEDGLSFVMLYVYFLILSFLKIKGNLVVK